MQEQVSASPTQVHNVILFNFLSHMFYVRTLRYLYVFVLL